MRDDHVEEAVAADAARVHLLQPVLAQQALEHLRMTSRVTSPSCNAVKGGARVSYERGPTPSAEYELTPRHPLLFTSASNLLRLEDLRLPVCVNE